ncbi:MAG: succinic semialdehyde dehydrogenase [Acidobacteriota bacterium]|nr:succinic semialdehyde dehydrogenase [Acidobacteriota bacterium]
MSATRARSVQNEITISNPATGERVGSVAVATAADVKAAALRARRAQPAWERLGVRRRRRVLERFHDLLFERQDEIFDTIQRESGKTRREALGELLIVAGTARYYLAHGEEHLAEESHPGASPLITGARVGHRPYGLVGFITPWNYPFILSIGDALPALLAGNAVLVKPSELTPLSAELGRDLLATSGLDADLVQLVHGPGATVGAELVDHVDYLGFTGSTATGRKVAVAAAERLIPCSLELGGKNPMIVLAGAPLEEAVTGLVSGGFYNTGQTCIAVARVYVESRIFDRFAALARRRIEKLKVGWSLDWDMDVGSLVSREHAAKVMRHVEDAVGKGATVLTGGQRRSDLGEAFVAPTLLTDVDESMELCREETFGPVVALYPVRDADEAVARANDSTYGLNASVWTGSARTSRALARRIEAGSVGINSTLLIYSTFDVPMGGVKESGIGRRHGRQGILRFTQAQSIVDSIATGGGYEGVLANITSEARARSLAAAFKLMRRIPGLR